MWPFKKNQVPAPPLEPEEFIHAGYKYRLVTTPERYILELLTKDSLGNAKWDVYTYFCRKPDTYKLRQEIATVLLLDNLVTKTLIPKVTE